MDERFDKHFMEVETLMAINVKKKKKKLNHINDQGNANHRDYMFHLPDFKNFKQQQ